MMRMHMITPASSQPRKAMNPEKISQMTLLAVVIHAW